MTVLVLTVCPVMADRRGGNQSRLCLGACRCLVEDEGNRQVSQKLKALEQSQKQLTTIIIGGGDFAVWGHLSAFQGVAKTRYAEYFDLILAGIMRFP